MKLEFNEEIEALISEQKRESQRIDESRSSERNALTMPLQEVENQKVVELELICRNMKVEFDEKIKELISEHKQEVIKLCSFYEKEISEIKKEAGVKEVNATDIRVVENIKNKIKIFKKRKTLKTRKIDC